MSDSDLNLRDFLPYQLAVTSSAVSDLIARAYRVRFGLKIPEWRVMAVLGEIESSTQRELVTSTTMDKVTVNRACKALVDRNLLGRVPNSADGRSHHLGLTDAGRALYNEIMPEAYAIEKRLEQVMGAGEAERLSHILSNLRELAENMEP